MKSTLPALAATLLWAAPALAHVSLAGPVYANTTQVLTFGVGHGCEGVDTYKLEIRIPTGVTSIRPLPGMFGNATLTKDEAGNVTAVTWTKPVAAVLAGDTQYYSVAIRAKTPNTPFKALLFPTIQTCRTPGEEGVETVTDWVGAAGQEGVEPAPSAVLLPARRAGWNKVVVPEALADLTAFADAQIVWAGNAAFSANPDVAALIETDPEVDTLATVAAGTTLWVKY